MFIWIPSFLLFKKCFLFLCATCKYIYYNSYFLESNLIFPKFLMFLMVFGNTYFAFLKTFYWFAFLMIRISERSLLKCLCLRIISVLYHRLQLKNEVFMRSWPRNKKYSGLISSYFWKTFVFEFKCYSFRDANNNNNKLKTTRPMYIIIDYKDVKIYWQFCNI